MTGRGARDTGAHETMGRKCSRDNTGEGCRLTGVKGPQEGTGQISVENCGPVRVRS